MYWLFSFWFSCLCWWCKYLLLTQIGRAGVLVQSTSLVSYMVIASYLRCNRCVMFHFATCIFPKLEHLRLLQTWSIQMLHIFFSDCDDAVLFCLTMLFLIIHWRLKRKEKELVRHYVSSGKRTEYTCTETPVFCMLVSLY